MRRSRFPVIAVIAAMEQGHTTGAVVGTDAMCASYRQLAEIYHDLLSREGLEQLLERLVKTVRQLIPVTSILVAEARLEDRVLVPLVAAGDWPDGFLEEELPFGQGLIGVAVERGRPILSNEAHLDARAGHVAGTPQGEPEAIISVPLVAGGMVIGAMSLYREGADAHFTSFEYELAQRFGDAATLALENARIRAELRNLAVTDELTGVLNRRGFTGQMTAALQRASRGDVPTALVVVDLNNFKAVNDAHGHPCGDRLLQHVARVLATLTRIDDHVCRIGGDEFALILTRCEGGRATEISERIAVQLAANPMHYANKLISVSASVGVVIDEEDGDVEGLLARADMALYAAKNSASSSGLRLVRDG